MFISPLKFGILAWESMGFIQFWKQLQVAIGGTSGFGSSAKTNHRECDLAQEPGNSVTYHKNSSRSSPATRYV